MTRGQQLQFCKVCQHKSFDVQQGIICSLTGRQADFQGNCPTFKSADGSDPLLDALEGKSSFNVEVAMASGTKRFINMIIDYFVFYVLLMVFVFVSAVVAGAFFPEEMAGAFDEDGSQLWIYVLIYAGYVFYYTALEAATGRTVGKLITGTRVVDENGITPDTGTIFRRSLSRLVPFEMFSFLSNSRGWHDKWTETWVVENK
jgi:uncharacterized RDD family membrane protein YckC